MAQGENKATLLGYVGKAPEVRTTAGNTLVVNFTIATTDRYKDREGAQAERTEWHNIAAFGRTAEIVRDYLKKGMLVYVEGKLETRSWTDKESQVKMFKTQIVVNHINILSGKPAGDVPSSDQPAEGLDGDSYSEAVPF